jgi:hypothetical protein
MLIDKIIGFPRMVDHVQAGLRLDYTGTKGPDGENLLLIKWFILRFEI